MGQDQELEGEFSVGSAESDIFSLDSMYGTNIYIYIYAAPLTPLAPPQLIGIFGIHGASDTISLDF